jgi:hypothetical protein
VGFFALTTQHPLTAKVGTGIVRLRTKATELLLVRLMCMTLVLNVVEDVWPIQHVETHMVLLQEPSK